MYKNKKVVVVLPAYNAALTLEKTYKEIPLDLVDEIILHVGGAPEQLPNEASAIYAPFKPNELPQGFSICQRLEFGVDLALRLHREKGECSPE